MANVGRHVEPDPDALSAEQQAARAEILSTRASVPTPFRLFLESPKLALLLAPLGEHLVRNSSLTRRETEIAILATARKIGSEFVAAAHHNAALREDLDRETIVTPLYEGRAPRLDDAREQLVYELAVSMHDDSEAPQALYDRAIRLIGAQGIADLAALRGFYVACAGVLSAHAVAPPALT
jgi:4-carboxymuconolactone decarboxylase